jgi:hypothetical protein
MDLRTWFEKARTPIFYDIVDIWHRVVGLVEALDRLHNAECGEGNRKKYSYG